MADTVALSIDEARDLGRRALAGCGASAAVAGVMADALVEAEAEGLSGVGLAHLLTYCEGLRDGRIDRTAEPVVSRPAGALFRADARGGVGHLAYETAFPEFSAAARDLGVAVFAQSGSFTNAALDWFVLKLARAGLVGLAGTNGGPAFLAASGSTRPVFCTNPMAFAAPRADGPPLLVDQSSSATAFVNLVLAAERGEPIPEGWALDADGRPTTEPAAAMAGVLLPFGGARGANVALIVEVLSAGLSGGNWSLDAPSFLAGADSPGIGLFVLAVNPDALCGGGFADRLGGYLKRLKADYGVHVPGEARAAAAEAAHRDGITVATEMVGRLRALAAGR